MSNFNPTRAAELAFAVANLRHLYQQMLNGHVRAEHIAEAATGLLGPAIEKLERGYADRDALTRERDEARAEVERLGRVIAEEKRLGESRLQGQLDLMVERDRLARRVSTLTTELAAARGEVELLKAENEWMRKRFDVHHPAPGSRPDDLTPAEEKLDDICDGISKLKLDLSDPHTRAVWESVLEAKREVESWPAWKRGDAALKERDE